MPLTTVQKIIGAMIILTNFMKPSPRGFMALPMSGNTQQHADGYRCQYLKIQNLIEFFSSHVLLHWNLKLLNFPVSDFHGAVLCQIDLHLEHPIEEARRSCPAFWLKIILVAMSRYSWRIGL